MNLSGDFIAKISRLSFYFNYVKYYVRQNIWFSACF